ncbi:hypothetical protein [Endozoicomonas sp. SCSIO W0465]|uniref:hypothetical protein n=1 Tax=Endozoicomonas sp. SCSIO W0465 TaxID=2918516 RepID=UPI0020765FF1|nr:hypothetical protein [Endozoicomonas sp. SCSIO W0465]USE34818.1 hypothetical protein MJO57_22205 [Endozoicomonas sp. SCSIO W0465]
MCNGKGLPEKAKVEAFLKLGCLKEGWQGNDEALRISRRSGIGHNIPHVFW